MLCVCVRVYERQGEIERQKDKKRSSDKSEFLGLTF